MTDIPILVVGCARCGDPVVVHDVPELWLELVPVYCQACLDGADDDRP
jgi:hypothetical protein